MVNQDLGPPFVSVHPPANNLPVRGLEPMPWLGDIACGEPLRK